MNLVLASKIPCSKASKETLEWMWVCFFRKHQAMVSSLVGVIAV